MVYFFVATKERNGLCCARTHDNSFTFSIHHLHQQKKTPQRRHFVGGDGES